MTEKIIILDFGSQVTQLIGRRLRELGVFCEIHPFNKIPVLTLPSRVSSCPEVPARYVTKTPRRST